MRPPLRNFVRAILFEAVLRLGARQPDRCLKCRRGLCRLIHAVYRGVSKSAKFRR